MNIIQLLGIEYKEDIISNMLVGLINESENFRVSFLENIIGISNARLYSAKAFTRIATSKGIPDIIIKIYNNKETILTIIENKIKAEEGYEQTKRYSEQRCIEEICSNKKINLDYNDIKMKFIYLTLIPEQITSGEKFVNKTYKDLLNSITVDIEDVLLDRVFKDFMIVIKEFYDNLDVNENDKLLDILCDDIDAEKVYIRFKNLMRLFKAPEGLNIKNIGKAGGVGRVSFIAQIAKDAWCGSEKADFIDGFYNVNNETYDIHLEFSFDILNKVIKLPLHYETNPYIPKHTLIKCSKDDEYKKYIDRREVFKGNLHEKINSLGNRNIKTYNGSNQIANINIILDNDITVKEFLKILQEYCENISILVDEVLSEMDS